MQGDLIWQHLQHDVKTLVDTFAGVAGISVLDLMSGERFQPHGDELYPTASTIKIHILTQLCLRAERGEVDLAQRVRIDQNERVLGSGVLAYLEGPTELTLLDIAILMIIVSDNTATNICLQHAGLEATNQLLETLGLTQTKVRRKMMDHLAAVQEQENVSTPNELVQLMAMLRQGHPNGSAAARVLEILRKPKNSTLREALPEGTIFANKPGYVEGARCDVGIVELARRPYIIALMSKYAMGSPREHSDALVEMARTIHRHFLALDRSNQFGRTVY
jgi:beta-lactamase class A